ncbi:MAG: pantoate--beta-alanine ligase [Actinomycetes bacterium]|jgi:pantoate--beta-alanine ligase
MSQAPLVANTRVALDAVLDSLEAGVVHAVVPTMGALHEGHATLIRAARQHVGAAGLVTVTIFVNPTQFSANEDFDRYPRTLQADIDLCAASGADVVFAPAVSEVYPTGATEVTVHPGPLGDVLEGAVRPGHFQGVLTVVNKLFNLTCADVGFFGEKDYQQLILIRHMVRDLSMSVEVVGVPTVREPDGLAMSSRNRYLDSADRGQAELVPRAISAGSAVAQRGGSSDDVIAEVQRFFDPHLIEVDYVVVTDPELGPAPVAGEGRLVVAVRVGSVRLLDNSPIQLGAPA